MTLFHCMYTGCFYLKETNHHLRTHYLRQHQLQNSRTRLCTGTDRYSRIMHEVNPGAEKWLRVDRLTSVALKQSSPFESTVTDEQYEIPTKDTTFPALAALKPVNDPFHYLCASFVLLPRQTSFFFWNQVLKIIRMLSALFPAFFSVYETNGDTIKHMQQHIGKEFRT